MKTLNSQTKPMHTIATLSQQIDDEVLSPTALIEHCLERIERLDGEYRTYISVMRDDAQAAAEQALLRAQQKKRLSPIDGLPIAIKDIAATKGVLTTAGSPILKDYVPDRDARIVTALRNAGAVIIGKNNMHEYAYGVTSDNETYGRVVNPLFPGHLPGGSSGGTAAAVAADLAIAGIGSDTGGSIRIPAACCGLVGLKPTFGVLSTDDCIPQAWSLDHLGPITHTVTDARLLYTSLTAPERSFQHTDTHPKPLNQLKIGIPRSLINLAAPQIQEAFDDVVNSLAACGAVVEFFDYSNWDEAYRSWLVTMLAESANYHQLNLRETPDKLDSGIRTYLAIGSTLTAGEYLNAQRYRKKWCTALEKEMARFDVIVNPTLPSRVPRRGDEQVETGLEDMSVRDALVLYQWTANLTGWPSIALPSRHKLDGIPLSIMMTMKPYQEVQLFSVAAAFEAQQSA